MDPHSEWKPNSSDLEYPFNDAVTSPLISHKTELHASLSPEYLRSYLFSCLFPARLRYQIGAGPDRKIKEAGRAVSTRLLTNKCWFERYSKCKPPINRGLMRRRGGGIRPVAVKIPVASVISLFRAYYLLVRGREKFWSFRD